MLLGFGLLARSLVGAGMFILLARSLVDAVMFIFASAFIFSLARVSSYQWQML